MKKNLFSFCVYFIPALLPAQQNIIDSLQTALKTALEDTSKVKILNRLSSKVLSINLEEASRHAEMAFLLSGKLNYDNGKSEAFFQKGYINFYEGKYDSALYYYEQSKILKEKINDKKGIARALNSIGSVHHDKGNYSESVNYYLQALRINEEEKNLGGIATALLNIGVVYSDQKNFHKSLEYKEKAYKVFLQTGDTAQIANALTRLGNVYWSLGQTDKSLNYYDNALNMFKRINHQRGIAIVYNNIAGIYDGKGEHQKALEIYLKGLTIRESIGDQNGIVILLNNIGNAYLNLKNYSMASSAFERSIKIAKDIGFKDMLRENYKNLSKLYASENDFKKAYDLHLKFFEVHDSLFNENSTKNINDLQNKYEIETRENKIALLSKDNELRASELSKSRLLRNGLIGGIAVVIILLYVLFNRNRLKQKTNLELEEKNKTIENAYTLIEEKNKDITDSINYAKRIQQGILPKDEEIKEIFPDSFVLFKPKDIVSGDFYWLSNVDEKTWLAVADCTGHGVPGALMSMTCSSLLNEAINNRKISTPAEALDEVRNGIIKSLKQTGEAGISRDGMDVILCVLDKSSNILSVAAANNPLILLKNSNEIIEIPADKQPVGFYHDKAKEFTNHKISLEKNDTFYLFSDGYADQFGGPKGKKFKFSQLKNLLLSVREKSMKEQGEILFNLFDKWRGDLEQVDDICVVGVRI